MAWSPHVDLPYPQVAKNVDEQIGDWVQMVNERWTNLVQVLDSLWLNSRRVGPSQA